MLPQALIEQGKNSSELGPFMVAQQLEYDGTTVFQRLDHGRDQIDGGICFGGSP
jgi:hypothetical protein